MFIAVLGRQPGLGLAELEATIGSDSIQPFGKHCAIIKGDHPNLSQQALGGAVRIAEIIRSIPSSNWDSVSNASINEITKYVTGKQDQPDHKLTLGVSIYGIQATPEQISRLLFGAKKRLKAKGRSARVVVSKDFVLNSAQVIHNKLTSEFGYEFLLVCDSKETYIARALSVQDIDSYTKRDYGRPKRDTKVGMLPPKLAQIMLNLAGAEPGLTVLDPFCGTGVVLMEAALKGLKVVGSDISQRMVDYSKANLEWLAKEYNVGVDTRALACADATAHKWKYRFDIVASETYLGPVLTDLNKMESLDKTVDSCNLLIKKFLANLRPQLNSSSRCCIAVPVWKSKEGFIHLPVVGQLADLGYWRVEFQHASFDQMVYHRPDQAVGRELLVLTPR